MVGIIPLSGFWAKDEILVVADEEQNIVVYAGPARAASSSRASTWRALFILTFLGEPRGPARRTTTRTKAGR